MHITTISLTYTATTPSGATISATATAAAQPNEIISSEEYAAAAAALWQMIRADIDRQANHRQETGDRRQETTASDAPTNPQPEQQQAQADPPAKPVYQPPKDAAEAEQRFYARYGATIGGSTWADVQKYLHRPRQAQPTTIKEWVSVAETVRDREKQRTPQPSAVSQRGTANAR